MLLMYFGEKKLKFEMIRAGVFDAPRAAPLSVRVSVKLLVD